MSATILGRNRLVTLVRASGCLRVFGIYTKTSALVILSLNALTSALNCVPIFFFARRSFGDRVALWSGWAWAAFPYAIYFSVERIWSTWLSTLLLSLLFLVVLHLQDSDTVWKWVAYGLLWGLAGLTEPIVLSVLPFLSLSACHNLRRRRKTVVCAGDDFGVGIYHSRSPMVHTELSALSSVHSFSGYDGARMDHRK